MPALETLSGAGKYRFASESIDHAAVDALGCFETQAEYERAWKHLHSASPRRRYVAGVDIGERDATVVVVLDATEDIFDVVGFYYLSPCDIGQIQSLLLKLHRAWPDARLLIEDNNAGHAIRSNVPIPESHCAGFLTTAASKQRIIGEVEVLVHERNRLRLLKWNPAQCPQLDSEIRGYKTNDANIKQDCVIALSLAVEAASSFPFREPGRLLPIIYV